jgi:hypothetical protein
MFPSNVIKEIKKLVFCGTVIFCGTYTCSRYKNAQLSIFVFHISCEYAIIISQLNNQNLMRCYIKYNTTQIIMNQEYCRYRRQNKEQDRKN